MPSSPHVRNIALDLILTLLTCGLFNFYVQYKQMMALNDMLKNQKYDFLIWLFLCIITCGFYHFYHEFRMGQDLVRINQKGNENLTVVSILLLIFGLTFIVDAIQQAEINSYYGHHGL